MVKFWILTATLWVVLVQLSGAEPLDDYIRVYDTVHYDKEVVHNLHMRHKRSADSVISMDINGFGKTFTLQLKKDSSIFHPDFEMVVGNKTVTNADLSFLYKGKVKGYLGSRVDGSIIQGVFSGSFHLPSENETYHVEKSWRFFNTPQDFHSVVYKESDLDLDPYRERRARERREAAESLIHTGGCGYEQAKAWMREVQASVDTQSPNRASRMEYEWQEVNAGHQDKYSAKYNNPNTEEKPKRKKRETKFLREGTCYLFLRSDPIFWNRFMEKSGQNEEVARDEILAFFTSHVNAINNIYRNTVFHTYNNEIDSYTGIMFGVRRTLVMTYRDFCESTQVSAFCNENIDVSNFLNLNSLDNHDDYCLAYIFTYRDFSQGTLGLAWVGARNSASGGICEKMKSYTEGKKRVSKSLNTGIVTIINYGKEVPFRVSQLTFAHEIGHNCGSPHDSGPGCTPYGTSQPDAADGNYIMFASATMGDKRHNSEFSDCSKDNITRVLHEFFLPNPSKVYCLQSSEQAFCGNGLVEKDEECDCGFSDECQDQCCNARDPEQENPGVDCTRKANTQCSPSQGPCCSDTCSFIPFTNNVTCRYQTECSNAAYCDGSSAACPNSTNVADGQYCNNYGFTCINGECAGSLCDKFGWTECFTTGPTKSKEDQEKLCKLACYDNTTGECVLSSDIDKIDGVYKSMVAEVIAGRGKGAINDGIELAAGSPCNEFQGYCDVFHRCRGVDAEGPLARLKNLIFSEKTLETVRNWIVEHWWAVLLMAIGLILAMGLFIKFCAVHTPSSNPKAKPARKLSETMTLRRRRNQHHQPSNQPQQVRYPQTSDAVSPDMEVIQPTLNQGLLPDPKYPAKNPQGPPPPYPGSSSGGPPHGHGKKGRKNKDFEMGRI